MRVLYVTPEWPTETQKWAVPFLVRQVDALRRSGIEIEVFPFRGSRRLSNYYHIYRKLQSEIRFGNYDVIHAQWGHSGFLAGFPKRLPLVVTFRGSEVLGIYTSMGRYHPISYLLRLAMQYVAFVADEIVLVADCLHHYLYRRDYHVIPGGVDLNLFRPISKNLARQRLGLGTDKLLVAFVGSPSNPVKRYWLAKKTIENLSADQEAELMVVAGVTPDEVPIYLNAADALLVTSKHEGSPNMVKEAMACNLPVVAVNVGDIDERLAKVTGCAVVSSDDPQLIAQHLSHILRNPGRTNGREIVQELDENVLADKQIKVYERAICKKHQRTSK